MIGKMNPEWVIIGLVSLSTILYAVGGTGLKMARRFILPLILGLGCLFLGVTWWRALGVTCLAIGCFCLPYGQESSLFTKGLTSLAHGLCLAPLITGPNAFLMIIPIWVFIVNLWLSNRLQWWTHKIFELSNGFFIAVTLVLMCLSGF